MLFKKLFTKMLGSLSPEEKLSFREALADTPNPQNLVDEAKDVAETAVSTENVSEDREIKNKGEIEMPNIGEKTEEKVEVEKTTEKPENNEVESKEKSTETAEKKVESKGAENKPANNEEIPAEEPTANQVQEVEQTANAVRIEDLVTKDELAEKFAALEAKFDAVVKENQDLKDKYENKDFGNFQKQGIMQKDQSANAQFSETFDSYSKKFMS